jgi:4-amino-4-deoxy-L-arabinose transferase-like glycosyltransferase
MNYRRYFNQYGGIAGLVVVYILLVTAYSAAIPFSKGPDEYINYQYILFIAQNHRLPATLAEKQQAGVKADWQPLYHLAGGLAASAIPLTPPPALKVTWEPPTRRLIDLILPRATLVRTEDESAPFRGVYAVWQMGRWVSLILGLGTLLVTYCIGLTLWPGQPALATGLTALLVFIPRFLFTHAVLSDDTMLGFCLALYLLLLTRLLRQPTRRSWLFIGLGVTAGLAIVTKYTAVPAALGALLTISWAARRQHWPRSVWLRGVTLFSGALAMSVSWWVGWVWWHFNQVSALGPVPGLVKPLLPGAAVDDNPTTARLTTLLSGQSVASLGEAPGASGNWWDWLQHTFTTLWGVTVYGAEPNWPYPYTVILVGLTLLSAAAVIGGWRVYRRTEAARQLIWQVFILHLLLFFPLPLLRFALSGRLNDAAQGRHLLFPAGPVIAALLLAGCLAWFRPRWRSRVSLIAAGAMLIWGIGHLIYLWSAYPPPLPVRTTPGPQVEVEHPLGVNFGDMLQLNGYQTRLNGSMLQLDLAWQSLAQAKEDYRTEITLVDRQGQSHLRWVSQPVNGRFPTRAWQPGDWVRDTLYRQAITRCGCACWGGINR